MEGIQGQFLRIGERISGYFVELADHPLNIVSLILDLLIVGYILFKVFKIARNSRAVQLFKGILLFMFLTWLSGLLKLTIVHAILSAILPSGVVALVVIFQPEIRRGLEQIGTNKIINFFGMEKDLATKTKEEIYKIVVAVEEMAKKKIGALIVIQRDISLSDIINTGVPMNSEISAQLICNIFVPNTPLHDGAVIIENNRIKSAACILPLASNSDISKELGTRHRAALGVSKETDAVAIVVSEESGKVSLAKDGTLLIDLDEDQLKKILINSIVTNRLDVNKYTELERLKARKIVREEKRKAKKDSVKIIDKKESK